MSTLLEKTAERYRLKVRLDECGDQIVPGRFGQIYEHGDGKLAILYMPDPAGANAVPPKMWNTRRGWMVTAGFTIWQDCDGEGTALFDPENKAQVKLAIRVAGVKRKKNHAGASAETLVRARAAWAAQRAIDSGLATAGVLG